MDDGVPFNFGPEKGYVLEDPRSIFDVGEEKIPPKKLSTRDSENFRSHMRKAARLWWLDWCEQNLQWGDVIEVTSDAGMGTISEVGTYTYCDDSHIHVRIEKWGGLSATGLPTCFVIAIEKVKESWDDEWL